MSELILEFYEDVLERVRDEIGASPDYEVGGKFVGWIEGDFDASSRSWRRELAKLRIVVGGFIDDGPLADRSAVHHYSDNEYQFRVYQRLIQEHPDVEFLGLWHSHHPNGYAELSGGDHHTGHALVNDGRYAHDLVLSSLALDEHGLTRQGHHLFLRGHRQMLRISPRSVQLRKGTSPISAALGRATEAVLAAGRPAAQPTEGDRQAAIAFDNRWLAGFPWLKPVLRREMVVWAGETVVAGERVKAVYAYEDGYGAPPAAVLSAQQSGLTLKAVLAEPGARARRLHDALGALSEALRHWQGDEGSSRIEQAPSAETGERPGTVLAGDAV
ncbi:hypothetical protein ACFQY4_16945 [Catellatospora bangladeshensis]|uniref:Uncharacterized protein n=1 Tax=Catellatospora bangladeshensis TaxID=310355 RepID=A0A8J3JP77_9ACTN|nr:hypothetical protein [Catellatospora bangladeshensis]GIF84203.1 hypothetical protein Cba03nite_55520 [Catellatospora bangladeshensis]